LRALFRVLDVDGSGRLDEAEFRHALDMAELSIAVDEASQLFAEMDADGDGTLTVEEFVLSLGSDGGGSDLLRRVRAGLTPRRVQMHALNGRCRAWFRTMDEDKDGAIDFSEFASGLLFLGVEIDDAECRALFGELDENRDSKIDFEEFSRGAVRRLGSLDRAGTAASAEADPMFSDAAVNIAVLRKRAYNYRWAVQPPDVIPLTAADPDFPVAPEIVRAIEAYVKAGHLSYGPAEGLPELRSIASERLSARGGVACSPEAVFVTDGAASALFLVARFALKEPGDEAIVFDPVDFLFERSALAAGGVVKRLPLRRGRDYSFDPDELESLVTSRTRLLSICSPHNPLGRVWTKRELEQLTTVAVRHNLWILSDEVWSDIVYPPHRHISTASVDPEVHRRTFSIFGFSKSYGLAGLRLGLLISPTHDVHRAIVRISHADDTAYGVSTLSQVAGTAAYRECDGWLERFLVHLRSQRDYAVDRLNRMGASCIAPQGTYVVFPNVSAITSDATVLAAQLLAHHRVAVVPGSPAFFGPGAEGHLRMSFATSRSILKEGLDRVEAGLEAAKRKSERK
jgi:aspartate/methionine/tyrosine aminotransferase/Ca2+-binding EF-hand superfamily protein